MYIHDITVSEVSQTVIAERCRSGRTSI